MDERQYEHAAQIEQREREAAIERARRIDVEPVRERGGVRYCIACDDPIDPRRLAARPSAVRCIDCQHDHDRYSVYPRP